MLNFIRSLVASFFITSQIAMGIRTNQECMKAVDKIHRFRANFRKKPPARNIDAFGKRYYSGKAKEARANEKGEEVTQKAKRLNGRQRRMQRIRKERERSNEHIG